MYTLLPKELWQLVFASLEPIDIKSVMDTCKLLNSWYWERIFSKGHKGDTIFKWFPNLVTLSRETVKALSYDTFLRMIQEGEALPSYKRNDLDERLLRILYPNGFDQSTKDPRAQKVNYKKVKYHGIYDLYIKQSELRIRELGASYVVSDSILSNPYMNKDSLESLVKSVERLTKPELHCLLGNNALTTEQIKYIHSKVPGAHKCVEHKNAPIKSLPKWIKRRESFNCFIKARITDDELAHTLSELKDRGIKIFIIDPSALSHQVCYDILHGRLYPGTVFIRKYYKSPLSFSDFMVSGVFNEQAMSNYNKFLSKTRMTIDDILILWNRVFRKEPEFWLHVSSNPCVTWDVIKANPTLTWDINGLLINPSFSLKDMLEVINRRYM